MHYDLWFALSAALSAFEVERRTGEDRFTVTRRGYPPSTGLLFGGLADACDLREITRSIADGFGLDAQEVFSEACERALDWLRDPAGVEQERTRNVARLGPYAAIEIARRSSPSVRRLLDDKALGLGQLVARFEAGERATEGEARAVWLAIEARRNEAASIGDRSATVYLLAQSIVAACERLGHSDVVQYAQWAATRPW